MITIGLGLIVAEGDLHMFNKWLIWHLPHFNHLYVAVDGDPQKILYHVGRYNINIIKHSLDSDFAQMRKRVVEMNLCDWLMMVDIDEFLMPDLLENIRELATDDRPDVIGFPRINITNSVYLNNYPDYQYRLIKKGIRWVNNSPHRGASPGCHETPYGSATIFGYNILHYKYNFEGNFRQKGQYKDENS